jgi:hypothetical protein
MQFLFCGLFYDTASISGYIASNDKTIGEYRHEEG